MTMNRALASRLTRLEGKSPGAETGVVVFSLALDADRNARIAELRRDGFAQECDCFIAIPSARADPLPSQYRVAGTMREFMGNIAENGWRIFEPRVTNGARS